MTREELLALLRDLAEPGDPEASHAEADEALLAFINDDEVREAYEAVERWYA